MSDKTRKPPAPGTGAMPRPPSRPITQSLSPSGAGKPLTRGVTSAAPAAPPPTTKAHTAVSRALEKTTARSTVHKPASAEALEQDQARTKAWTLLADLSGLMKAAQLHDVQHPVTRQAAVALCESVAAMPPPFVLQFVAGGLFVDRTLVPLDFVHYEKCQAITFALRKLAAHELSFEMTLGVEPALQLAQAMAGALRGQLNGLKNVEIQGVTWRDIPFAQSGIDAEGVDPDVAAIAHTLLGLQVAEQIAAMPAGAPWPWSMGLAVVRRLEKGLAANAGAAMRVVEFAPEGWPISRRALSCCQLVLQVLTRVDMDATNRRAAAHAALALALCGLRPRDGLDPWSAADALVRRMLSAPIQAESGVAPQCLLVAALVHQLGSAMRGRRGPASLIVTDLIDMAYELERARCPARVPFDLGRADLLAFLVQNEGTRFSPDWVRVVIKVCGAVPVGACVQLRDGRVGVVIEAGPSHAPWCPVVFTEGETQADQVGQR